MVTRRTPRLDLDIIVMVIAQFTILPTSTRRQVLELRLLSRAINYAINHLLFRDTTIAMLDYRHDPVAVIRPFEDYYHALMTGMNGGVVERLQLKGLRGRCPWSRRQTLHLCTLLRILAALPNLTRATMFGLRLISCDHTPPCHFPADTPGQISLNVLIFDDCRFELAPEYSFNPFTLFQHLTSFTTSFASCWVLREGWSCEAPPLPTFEAPVLCCCSSQDLLFWVKHATSIQDLRTRDIRAMDVGILAQIVRHNRTSLERVFLGVQWSGCASLQCTIGLY